MKTRARSLLAAGFAALALVGGACNNNTEITDQPGSDPQPGLQESPREEEN